MGQQVTGILRNYVEARLRFYDAGLSMARTEAAAREATALQRQLWSYVVEVARAHPDSEMAALFVEAADGLVDAGDARRAALDNHVPLTVFVVLLLVAAAATGASGYSCGLRRRRHKFGMIVLPLLITAVVLLVLDLDHPRGGADQGRAGAHAAAAAVAVTGAGAAGAVIVSGVPRRAESGQAPGR